MEQLLKDEVDSLLKSRQAGNKLIGPFPQVELPFFDVADATFDVVDSKQGGRAGCQGANRNGDLCQRERLHASFSEVR